MSAKRLFTSESVTEGHPDKICDQISDAVLDAILERDPEARVACECAITTGLVLVMGEITCNCYVDISSIARETIREIGYTRAKYGFDCDTCAVISSIDEQSSDIKGGVECSFEIRENIKSNDAQKSYDSVGAGDQGMMFGYASNESKEYMPMSIVLAHKLSKALAQVRKDDIIPYLRPDGKTQVSLEYDGNKVIRVDSIVISTQHHPDVNADSLRKDIYEKVILPIVPNDFLDEEVKIFINPSGRFVIGGPQGDSGLTGRKIIVDTYGGMARHGGGAFSGKDPTKVDRSASYAARHIAKNVVASGLADRCEIQVAYAIGVAHPISVNIDTFGTGKIPDAAISDIVKKIFDMRPAAIIERFDLKRPIYKQTAAYGHFGRLDLDLPWEKLDMVGKLQSMAR